MNDPVQQPADTAPADDLSPDQGPTDQGALDQGATAEAATAGPVAGSLAENWQVVWPDALARWSAYTQLRPPSYYETDELAKAAQMEGKIAAIRLRDQAIMVNLATIRRLQLEGDALAILAHEIGHHVYVPGNLSDNARMLAAMKPVLFGLAADTVHLVANLYGDLMINDRLQRRADVDIAGVYRKLKEQAGNQAASQTWKVYARTYECLWLLPAGTLSPPGINDDMHADALLLARLIRHYAGHWLGGARRFACILYPYLQADEEANLAQIFVCLGLGDLRDAGAGALPDGLVAIDAAELGEDADFDRELAGMGGEERDSKRRKRDPQPHKPENTVPEKEGRGTPGRQFREPFEYGELLKALGLNLSEHEVTTRYYHERALPHLIPFPARPAPHAKEPLAEGYEAWDAGEDLEKLDVFGSLLRSPQPIPGVTTVQRVYGETPGSDPARTPLDLDLYVDSSGSMPNPAVNISYLTLSAAILALSALRMGARVQATLWSGAGQFETTAGFIRDERLILGVLCGYLGDGTAFPLHVLRDTYASRPADAPPVHIVVISDDGVDTMLAKDEQDTLGADVCTQALQNGRGGGTLVLNVHYNLETWSAGLALQKLGFRIHQVTAWEELVAFARQFVRETYET